MFATSPPCRSLDISQKENLRRSAELKAIKTMRVSELKEELSRLNDDDDLSFGNGDLSFNRMKYRGDKTVNLEFNEIYDTAQELK